MPSHPSPYYIRCTSRTQRTYRYQCWLNPSYLTLLPCNVGPVGFVVFAPVERRRDHALRETDKLFDASHVLPTAVAKYQVPRLVLRTRGPRRVLLGQLLILSCRVVYQVCNFQYAYLGIPCTFRARMCCCFCLFFFGFESNSNRAYCICDEQPMLQ